jgi:DNA polymerase V
VDLREKPHRPLNSDVAGLLQVFIMTDRFRDDRPQYNPSVSLPLPMATADTMTLHHWACKGLEAIFKAGYQYKKAGVILGQISRKSVFQTDLFESAPQSPELMRTIDSLNRRFGKGTIRLSQDGARRAWTMRQDRKSPDYTTNWKEVARCQ